MITKWRQKLNSQLKRDLRRSTGNIEAEIRVMVQIKPLLNPDDVKGLEESGLNITSRTVTICSGTIQAKNIAELAKLECVISIEKSHRLRME